MATSFKLVSKFIVVPMLMSISAAHAESQTYTFSGTLSEHFYHAYDEQTNASFTDFTVTITLETSAILVYQDPTTQRYENAVGSISFRTSGPGSSINAGVSPNYTGTLNEITYIADGANGDSLFAEVVFDTSFAFPVTVVGSVLVEQIEQPFIQLNGLFPGVLSGDYAANFEFSRIVYERGASEPFGIWWGAGQVTNVVGTLDVFDSDGDGISDDVDACTSSAVDETVSFGGWYETGVTNYVDESGCTVMDRYAACEVEVETQPTAPAGPMFSAFSGPSYCESQVALGLQSDGVIDYSESRMLRNALYNYYRSGGNVN